MELEEAAGDERTLIHLRRKVTGHFCLHCSSTEHEHTSCPSRPCYTCGVSGHLARACPHRRRPISRSDNATASLASRGFAHAVLRRHLRQIELGHTHALTPPRLPSLQLTARVRARYDRAHERRVTALAWHPRGRHALSGDKRGVVALTDAGADAARGHFAPTLASGRIHDCNVSAFGFDTDSILWSSSMDGRVRRSHLERLQGDEPTPPALADTSLDLNPNGWHGTTTWRSVTALAVVPGSTHTAYAGSCRGAFYHIDARMEEPTAEMSRMHREKVSGMQVNPARPELLLSTSNDRGMCLWDARKLHKGGELARFKHPRCIFAASFSPNTGAKIVSTCHDNRVRVWRDANALVGECESRPASAPVEIVHSNNFNRYLSPFVADWDPKDWTDDLFMVGRFLGDAYRVGTDLGDVERVLHPIDLFSASRAAIVSELFDIAVTTRCPLNRFSPVEDIIVSGTSLHLVFWAPPGVGNKSNIEGGKGEKRRDGGDEDDEGKAPRKKRKVVTTRKKNAATSRNSRRTAKSST